MKNCGRAVTSWRRCGGNVICAKMLVVAPRIPGRGCISVAEDVPVCGPNPREGIHKAVCTAAVHRRWFWRWRKYEKNGNDILEGKKQIMYCKAPQFRTEMARCFGASDTCGAMGVRRASRHHTCYATCGVTKRKASPRPILSHCCFTSRCVPKEHPFL